VCPFGYLQRVQISPESRHRLHDPASAQISEIQRSRKHVLWRLSRHSAKGGFQVHRGRQRRLRFGVRALFIGPGSPWENGYCESLNGKLQDELLDAEIFDTLRDAQAERLQVLLALELADDAILPDQRENFRCRVAGAIQEGHPPGLSDFRALAAGWLISAGPRGAQE
jgi:transposase InsO family protein